MLKGYNIICFGSEKWDYPGMQQTVMKLLAPYNRVVYFNSLGTRRISAEYRQVFRLAYRLAKFYKRSNPGASNVVVCNPSTTPIVYNNTITKINTYFLRKQVNKVLLRHRIENYILWIGSPSAVITLGFLNPDLLVYNPVDRYSAFSFVDADAIRERERTIAMRADVIIATSDAIRNDFSPYNQRAYTVTHGVDFQHFNFALNSDFIPEDIKNIPKPIIGYFGGLSERVDVQLLSKVANQYRKASIVLIGSKSTDLSELERIPNVHILGQRDFKVLPYYLNQFSVCLIPYLINDLMEAVDPIKLREYLCQGKPVVSVALPEVRKLNTLAYVAENHNDFVGKVGKAMEELDPALMLARIDAVKQSDWSTKIEEITDIVTNAIRDGKAFLPMSKAKLGP